ncbi:unnamed protein product [Peniophora sp. CBMAI 1063]|nr:unnamed protein product [Peniophora sp. CBMAI 1063]
MPQLSPPISSTMTPDEILRKYGWVEDNPYSDMREVWNTYWNKEVEPLQAECPSEWQAALDAISDERVPELIELAMRFGVISEDEPRLPEIAYYDVGCLSLHFESTDGRLIEFHQYPQLCGEIGGLRNEKRRGGVVVTGQSGSGKTFFMFYFLIQALMRTEPVLLSMCDEEHYLFLPDGVWALKKHIADPDSSSRQDFLRVVPKGTWALVNCDDMRSAPSSALSHGLVFFPVYFAPPHSGKYDALLAVSHPPFLRIMSPMTSREIVACCAVLSEDLAQDRSHLSLKGVLNHMGVFGHAPKPCLESMQGITLESAIRAVTRDIQKVNLEQLRHILVSLDQTDDGSLSYTSIDIMWDTHFRALFMIQRIDDWPSDHVTLSFASTWILQRILESFTLRQRDYTRTFVSVLLQDHRKLGSATGVMFESLMHHVLSAAPSEWDGRFDLIEIELDGPAQRMKDNPHAVEITHIFRKRALLWYFTRCPPKFHTQQYFVPESAKNPTFDAVIYDRLVPEVVPVIPEDQDRGRRAHDRRAFMIRGQSESSRRSVSAATPVDGYGRRGESASIDFESAMAYPSRRSTSMGTRAASSSVAPCGPSPTPFSSRSRSNTHMSSVYSSRERSSAPDKTTPGVRVIKRKKSAVDRPPSSKTGHKVAKTWDESQHCIALQMTIAAVHKVKDEGLERLMDSFEPRHGNWSFIFVTPKSRPMNMKEQKKILEKLDESWRNKFRWYNLIVDIAHPGYLDVDLPGVGADSDDTGSDIVTVPTDADTVGDAVVA